MQRQLSFPRPPGALTCPSPPAAGPQCQDLKERAGNTGVGRCRVCPGGCPCPSVRGGSSPGNRARADVSRGAGGDKRRSPLREPYLLPGPQLSRTPCHAATEPGRRLFCWQAVPWIQSPTGSSRQLQAAPPPSCWVPAAVIPGAVQGEGRPPPCCRCSKPQEFIFC